MPAPWYVAAFRSGYLDLYAHRDEAAARDEVAFLSDEVLGPCQTPAVHVLDAGCGAGRHARALAALGRLVTGLDLSADLLAAAARRGGGPSYVRGDLRALPFATGTFAAVASFFTAFGYFSAADDDRRQLREFRRVVRRGGALLLDFLNAPVVRRTLVPRSVREVAGARMVEERAIRGDRVEKDVMVTREGGDALQWRESVRLYTANDLADLLTEAGFSVSSVRGALDGRPFDPDTSPRCVLIGVGA